MECYVYLREDKNSFFFVKRKLKVIVLMYCFVCLDFNLVMKMYFFYYLSKQKKYLLIYCIV